MVDFRVDDSFYDHPKVWDAPDCAVALWTRAGSWSSRNLTEGFVPAKMIVRFCEDPETASKELLDRELWVRVKDGFQFKNWIQYQRTREQVEQEKKANAERQKKWREKKKQQASEGDVTDVSRRYSRVSNSASNGVTNSAPIPPPSLPYVSPNGETSTTGETQELNEGVKIHDWARPLVNALTAEGMAVRWNLASHEWATLQTLIRRLGEPAMIEHARRSFRPENPPGHVKYFLKVWRDLPPIPADAPLKPEIAAPSKQLTTAADRKQQATDDLFADAYARAEAKDRAEAEKRNS